MENLKSEFRVWLVDRLKWFEVDDEVYTDYIQSIIDDNDDPDSADSPSLITKPILEFLSPAVSKDMTSFGEELTEWITKLKQPTKNETKTQRQNIDDLDHILNNSDFRQENQKTSLSRDEQKKRRLLLEKYGFEIEQTDENGDIQFIDPATLSSKHKLEDNELVANANTKKVADLEHQKREKAKLQHQQKVQREKELLEKERLKKENAKRKTQKRERRRGPC